MAVFATVEEQWWLINILFGVDLGFSYLRGLHVYGYEISGFMTLWV